MGLMHKNYDGETPTTNTNKCCDWVAKIKVYDENSNISNRDKAVGLEYIQKALYGEFCQECFNWLHNKEAEYRNS